MQKVVPANGDYYGESDPSNQWMGSSAQPPMYENEQLYGNGQIYGNDAGQAYGNNAGQAYGNNAGQAYENNAGQAYVNNAQNNIQNRVNQPPRRNTTQAPTAGQAPTNPAADEEPELTRHLHGHIYDAYWTDNFGPEGPGGTELYMASCGCSPCLGPCCSDVRQKDWKHLFLTFTLWTVIVELIMLIIEFVLGGFTMPSLGPDVETLINLGGKYLPYIYCKGHAFRYVTPIVLHAGLLHYVFNMLFTYRVMLPREVYWGVIRTAVMYITCGIGGTILSLAFYPFGVSVGASGALCGIFGGYIVDVGRMWKKMNSRLKCSHGVNVGLYLVIMVVLGFTTSNIDNGAHLGGLLTGIFLGMIILQKNLVVRIIGAICLAVTWILPSALIYPLVKINCKDY